MSKEITKESMEREMERERELIRKESLQIFREVLELLEDIRELLKLEVDCEARIVRTSKSNKSDD